MADPEQTDEALHAENDRHDYQANNHRGQDDLSFQRVDEKERHDHVDYHEYP